MIFEELFLKTIHKQRLCALKFKYNESIEILSAPFIRPKTKPRCIFQFFRFGLKSVAKPYNLGAIAGI
ncbi:hypothetical protein LEP1GSC188_1006 [Leptospira weilii serovar Topaz str. LT2116]|uniref:Uncharacterized protein n=1 Tax=Leptospira weilii serovar Topaz str. LT2116 TaxID=1088540 RepID=M3GUX8_9LEPT|nr:hypothetical protein LEP1GSC188_1006 [Leptospira weilii serovar Topaz str. LT2116]